MANKPKSYDDLTGTNRGTYEEAVVSSRLRNGMDFEGARPDTPTGAAVHVDPALTPAPIYTPAPERIDVPVINNPGVLASAPTLAELNAAARADYAEMGGRRKLAMVAEQGGERPKIDDSGVSEEEQQAEITEAAEQRKRTLEEQMKKTEDEARDSIPSESKAPAAKSSASAMSPISTPPKG